MKATPFITFLLYEAIKFVFPDSAFNNEPIYESVKMFVVSNVNNRDQAREIISLETGLQVVKVEELPND